MISLDSNNWKTLEPTLTEWSHSTSVLIREGVYLIYSQIIPPNESLFKNKPQSFVPIIQSALSDQGSHRSQILGLSILVPVLNLLTPKSPLTEYFHPLSETANTVLSFFVL